MRQLPKECIQFIVFDLLLSRALNAPAMFDEFITKPELQSQNGFREWFLITFSNREKLNSISSPNNKTSKESKRPLLERAYYEKRLKNGNPFIQGIKSLFATGKYPVRCGLGFCVAVLEMDESTANSTLLPQEKKNQKISSAYLHNRLVVKVKTLVKSEIHKLLMLPDDLMYIAKQANITLKNSRTTSALGEFFRILTESQVKSALLDSLELSKWDLSEALKVEKTQTLLEISHLLRNSSSKALLASEMMRRINHSESIANDIRVVPDSLKISLVESLITHFDETTVSKVLLEKLSDDSVIAYELSNRISEETVKLLSSEQLAPLLRSNSGFTDKTIASIVSSLERRILETGQTLASILSALSAMKERSSSVGSSILNNICNAMGKTVKSYEGQISSIMTGQAKSTMQVHTKAQLVEQSWNSTRKDLLNSIEPDVSRWSKLLASLKESEPLDLIEKFISTLREGVK